MTAVPRPSVLPRGGSGTAGGSPGGAPAGRLRSLDAFRGATIAGMILVNNPGTWSAIYPPFRHAAWHGWTPTDLIFPYFLFIVGVAVALALGRRLERGVARTALLAKAGRRALILVALGLFMAAWPFLRLSPGLGLRDLSTLRLPGVLQRIGVCYLLAVLAYLWLKPRGRALLGAGLLLGYWAALAWIPVPGGEAGVLEPPAATLAAWVDRALLGDHLWSAANREWDPEGVLSTFPAVVTVLLGIAAGERLRLRGSGRATVRWLVGWGIALTVAGLAWDRVFPINKQLWTSSYVLFSGGTAFLALAAFHAVADLRPAGRGVRALEIYGVNAIAVFVGSGLLAKTLGLIRIPDGGGGTTSLAGAIWTHGFRPLGPPELASLLHAVVWVAGWWLVLWWMARRGIVWKV